MLAYISLPSFLIIFLLFAGSVALSEMPSLILGGGVLDLFFPCLDHWRFMDFIDFFSKNWFLCFFSKNEKLVFFTVSLFYISLTSALVFIIFFLLLFPYCCLASEYGGLDPFRLLIFSNTAFNAINFPLNTAFCWSLKKSFIFVYLKILSNFSFFFFDHSVI